VGARVLIACFLAVLLFMPLSSVTRFPVASASEAYELLIITPLDFFEPCRRLESWKTSTGMHTALAIMESMNASFDGVDAPARIKRGIEMWHRTCGVKYVLLVGDCDIFPIRYIHLDGLAQTAAGLNSSDVLYSACDLYYADLYDAHGYFHDWDADLNGHYGELWGGWMMKHAGPINRDRLDMFPDIAVGRVPASNVSEVWNYVEKVVSYETHAAGSDWLQKALVVNTDPDLALFNSLSKQIGGNLTAEGFAVTSFYEADPDNPPRPYRDRPSSSVINNEINYGKGFVNFAGHGSPGWCPAYGVTTDAYWVYVANSTGDEFGSPSVWCWNFCAGLQGLPAVADFGGDGYSDLAFFQFNGSVDVYYNQVRYGQCLFSYPFRCNHLAPFFANRYPTVGDFDDDGLADLLCFNTATGEVYVALSTFRNFTEAQVWHNDFLVGDLRRFVGDFNGDGLDDIGFVLGGNVIIALALSTGAGFSAKGIWRSNLVDDGEIVVPGDYNGDGLDDLALINPSGDVSVALSTGQMFADRSLWHLWFCTGDLKYGATVLAGDFDGSGEDDLALFLKDARLAALYQVEGTQYCQRADVLVTLSTGSYFRSSSRWQDYLCAWDEIAGVGDINHDGKTDALSFVRHAGGDPFDRLNNKDKYPIIFASACSTAEYAAIPPWYRYIDTSGASHPGTWSGEIFPYASFQGVTLRLAPLPASLQPEDPGCMPERFLLEFADRGAVAYIGGVEVLQDGPSGELNSYFIDAFKHSTGTLGEMWNQAIADYLAAHGFGKGEQDKWAIDPPYGEEFAWVNVVYYHSPCKIMLFGDPSLRVLGAPTTTAPLPPVIIIIVGGGLLAGGLVVAWVVFRRRH